MPKKNMTTCSACGNEIAKGSKVTCPNCGKVNKKPIYKRTWFIVLGIIILIGAIGSLNEGGNDASPTSQVSNQGSTTVETTSASTETEPAKQPIVVTVDDLIDALDSNALKAADTYKDQYVELTGEVVNIDSAGDYFSLGILADKLSLDSVHCTIKKEQLDAVMNFEVGEKVTILGTITDVGEVLGYFVDVEAIK